MELKLGLNHALENRTSQGLINPFLSSRWQCHSPTSAHSRQRAEVLEDIWSHFSLIGYCCKYHPSLKLMLKSASLSATMSELSGLSSNMSDANSKLLTTKKELKVECTFPCTEKDLILCAGYFQGHVFHLSDRGLSLIFTSRNNIS